MKWTVSSLVAAGAMQLLGCSRHTPRDASLSPADEAAWNRVVAALQQVAEEYQETLELEDPQATRRRRAQLAHFLDETSASLDHLGAPLAQEIGSGMKPIRARILSTDYQFGTECRALVTRILDRTQLRRTPRLKPDLASGKKLFAQACAPCHGNDGTGRTSSIAATMDPPPPDILHPQYNWSPYEMYNRVTYGGVETAMPSFEEGLTPAERWGIVFHLFAERWPPCMKPLPPIGADELAISGDFELGNKFGYGAAACLRREFLAPP